MRGEGRGRERGAQRDRERGRERESAGGRERGFKRGGARGRVRVRGKERGSVREEGGGRGRGADREGREGGSVRHPAPPLEQRVLVQPQRRQHLHSGLGLRFRGVGVFLWARYPCRTTIGPQV